MVLKLDPFQIQAIVAHAESTYPEECCGLLLGIADSTSNTVVEVQPVENNWSAEPAESFDKTRRYEIAPQSMLAAMREGRDRNLTIVGIYHSHPDNPAVPSECDRQLAWQHYSYVIMSVEQGVAIDWQSWSLDDTHQFQPEEIWMPPIAGERMSKGNGRFIQR
ncbi:M67 family metallopeptidase [Phormidesmis priestleyi]|uniref:M67 family metallopeptidase n=1 Tax=Phormidesmis priestleyi TaxID=268141 RepID=UPI00083A469C|nr:M67 family metallopeptidase [Phormidesmis priestleyi]